MSKNKVLEFIKRRFATDSRWLEGNCYYFAQILKLRFPEGEIYYDVIWGHFLFKLEDTFYDWSGESTMVMRPIKWDTFEKDYDRAQYHQIIKACVL